MTPPTTFSTLFLPGEITLDWCGPSLDEGPLPAVFYLALSARDSLLQDPFNQPVVFLQNHYRIRVFSLTIPAHEAPLEPQQALKVWEASFAEDRDILTPFAQKIAHAAEELVSKDITSEKMLGIAGLSRGAFLATHAAARSPLINTVLGYAPLTRLRLAKEFKDHLNRDIEQLDLHNFYDNLIGKNLRFYIGNHDERVSTSSCYQFIEGLSQASFQNKIRSPQVELIITPSIGHQGHGTSRPVFEAGAAWMAQKLGALNG